MKKIFLGLTLSLVVLFTGCSSKVPNLSSQTKQDSSKTVANNDSSSSAVSNNTTSSTSTSTDNTTASNEQAEASSNSDTNSSDDTSNSTDNTNKLATQVSALALYKVDKKTILSYTSMTKTALIKAIGKNYKQSGSALTFSNGLTFYNLAKDTSKPTMIKCSNNVEFMGIKNGMTFDKVQSILGKTSIIDTYLGTKTNKVYKIQYTYGKNILKVISPKKDGKNSFIELCIQ